MEPGDPFAPYNHNDIVNHLNPSSSADHDGNMLEITFDHHHQKMAAGFLPAPPPPPPPNVPQDSEEYRAYLKSRLLFECAAVSLVREKTAEFEKSEVANVPHLNPNEEMAARTKLTSKESSFTTSSGEDDEVGSNTEPPTKNMDPIKAKQMRRRLMNRDSARRSRRRKHEHTTDLQTRVDQLKSEKTSMLEQLTEMIQKGNEAANDNKLLKAQVEELRSQVKTLEETVKERARHGQGNNNLQQGLFSFEGTSCQGIMPNTAAAEVQNNDIIDLSAAEDFTAQFDTMEWTTW